MGPGKALPPGTLWVVEEIPGLVAGGDQTATLARGYWPSYNVPFYAEVYKTSGYPALDRLRRAERDGFDSVNSLTTSGNDGDLYDGGGPEYTIGAPRSKLFRRDEGKVVDLESFRTLLRYANYSDPYAIGPDGSVSSGAALCMRGDLGKDGKFNDGGAGGCYDTKVTSFRTGFRRLSALAVNGPSSSASVPGSVDPPFSWSSVPSNSTLHLGLPTLYDFDF